jgi:hypothetical protein
MQPSQPPILPNPIPSSYLDEIAAPQKQPGMSNKLLLGVIIGAVLIIIIFFIAALSSGGGSKAISVERLALRLQTLQKVSDNTHKNLKDSKLRALNSRLVTQLTNTNRDIAAPLEAADINIKKADKKLAAQENGEKLTKKLEDARLNGTLDRVYANEMGHELETSAILMENLFKSTKSKSLKKFLEDSYDDLSSLQKEFKDYTASNT